MPELTVVGSYNIQSNSVIPFPRSPEYNLLPFSVKSSGSNEFARFSLQHVDQLFSILACEKSLAKSFAPI